MPRLAQLCQARRAMLRRKQMPSIFQFLYYVSSCFLSPRILSRHPRVQYVKLLPPQAGANACVCAALPTCEWARSQFLRLDSDVDHSKGGSKQNGEAMGTLPSESCCLFLLERMCNVRFNSAAISYSASPTCIMWGGPSALPVLDVRGPLKATFSRPFCKIKNEALGQMSTFA